MYKIRGKWIPNHGFEVDLFIEIVRDLRARDIANERRRNKNDITLA